MTTPNGRADEILVDATNGVATLTINRAHRGNALSHAVLADIESAAHQIALDRGVRAVVVTGAGDRAFSAGADINELAGLDNSGGALLAAHGQRVFDALAFLPQPVVAAVNGVAFGGGLELALACDIRIGVDHARFAFPEVTLANVPGWGGTHRLPDVVGAGRARHMLLGGAPITAATALDYGLITELVPPAELRNRAAQIGAQLSMYSPLALGAIKRAVQSGLDGGQAAGQLAERSAVALCSGSSDQVAAVSAFLSRKQFSTNNSRQENR